MNEICPKKKIKFASKPQTKEWIDEDILETINLRDLKYKAATLSNDEEIWVEYRLLRNMVVDKIKRAKNQYYAQTVEHNKGDQKKLWKFLKSILPNKNATLPNEIQFEHESVSDPQKIADKFNNFYINSIETLTLANQTFDLDNYQHQPLSSQTLWSSFTLLEMNTIKNIVKSLKTTSGGDDGISTFVLKDAFEVYGNRFLDVINSSLRYGVLPENWKITTVIPVPKVAKATKCDQFRGIHISPIYEKLLETAVKDQLLDFCNNNDIFNSSQSGFRKNHSCESALLKVTNQWYSEIDKGKKVIAVFIDFKRAFETIDRDLLISKLHQIGLRGTVLKWFDSYLKNRYQIVKVKNCVSSKVLVKFGVPQGTVLGPLLFILYINDIVKHIKYCNISLFADDTMLFISGENVDEMINKLNYDLNSISKYLAINSLFINETKSKIILFGNFPRDIESDISIKINNCQLDIVEEIKYLGIILDSKLSFIPHVNFLLNKLSKKFYLINRLSKNLNMFVKLMLFKALVVPDIDYCSTVWSNVPNFKMNQLQILINRFMRMILKCNKYTPINIMCETLNLMRVKVRMKFNMFVIIHKILLGLMPKYLLEKILANKISHNYKLRDEHRLRIDICRTNKKFNTLFNKGLSEYNMLPFETRKIVSLKNFKIQLRKDICD